MCHWYYTTAPSTPPRNVVITDLDRASLNVTWQPPLAINENGPITSYLITYERAGGGALMSVTVNETEYVVISGLTPFVTYSVQVAARNVNGTGSLSSTVMQVSGQDGKYDFWIQIIETSTNKVLKVVKWIQVFITKLNANLLYCAMLVRLGNFQTYLPLLH